MRLLSIVILLQSWTIFSEISISREPIIDRKLSTLYFMVIWIKTLIALKTIFARLPGENNGHLKTSDSRTIVRIVNEILEENVSAKFFD